MMQKSKLESTVREVEKKPQEYKVDTTVVPHISGENFKESPLNHAQLLGNKKERKEVTILVDEVIKYKISENSVGLTLNEKNMKDFTKRLTDLICLFT